MWVGVCLTWVVLLGLIGIRNWRILFETGRLTDLATALCIVRGCLMFGVSAAWRWCWCPVMSPWHGPWFWLLAPGSWVVGPGSLVLSSAGASPGSWWLVSSWLLAGGSCVVGRVSLVPLGIFVVSLCTLLSTTGRFTDLATAPGIVGDCLVCGVISGSA